MARRLLLGMLTPSSNTTLEPVTTAMIAGLPEASAHFGLRDHFSFSEVDAGSLRAKSLQLAGADPRRVEGRGRLFELPL